METESVKQQAHQLVEELPDGSCWEDLMHEIHVRQAIEAGLEDSRAGRTQDVAKSQIWASEVKVHWTDAAVEHLMAIRQYIAQNSPRYADKVVDRLTRRSQQIAAFPMFGRVVPEIGLGQIREVIGGPYRIM